MSLIWYSIQTLTMWKERNIRANLKLSKNVASLLNAAVYSKSFSYMLILK